MDYLLGANADQIVESMVGFLHVEKKTNIIADPPYYYEVRSTTTAELELVGASWRSRMKSMMVSVHFVYHNFSSQALQSTDQPLCPGRPGRVHILVSGTVHPSIVCTLYGDVVPISEVRIC